MFRCRKAPTSISGSCSPAGGGSAMGALCAGTDAASRSAAKASGSSAGRTGQHDIENICSSLRSPPAILNTTLRPSGRCTGNTGPDECRHDITIDIGSDTHHVQSSVGPPVEEAGASGCWLHQSRLPDPYLFKCMLEATQQDVSMHPHGAPLPT